MKYILLHGMGQNAASWQQTVSRLPRDLQTVCPELREFTTEGDCRYDKMYAAFCDYCKKLSEPVNLCGLSLGAVLALNYAADFPKEVSALVLAAPQYEMPKRLLKMQNTAFKFMSEKKFKDTGFAKKDFISLTNSMADINLSAQLSAIRCPVLILCGEKDSANKRAAETLSEMLPNARFSLVEGAGHEVNIDNPQALADKLAAFSFKISHK